MKAEIIAVGTELLLGDILNTNAQFLARELATLGFDMHHQSVVGDNPEQIIAAARTAVRRSHVIIFTGGLGPTDDDLTREAVAAAYSLKLVTDEVTKRRIDEFFGCRSLSATENNYKQARVFEDGEVLTNENGTAPGLYYKKGSQVVILLPGPPKELEPMFLAQAAPRLRALSKDAIVSKTLHVFGIGEAALEDKLGDALKSSNPTAALYAKTGEVHIRITAKAQSERQALELADSKAGEIRALVPDNAYSDDGASLGQTLVELLRERRYRIAVAESVTGGMVAAAITDVAGASEVFEFATVVYSDRAKRTRLRIPAAVLEKHTAVSGETAALMASAVRQLSRAEVSIATTGYAGPGGDPAGLVYIAAAVGERITVRRLMLGADRGRQTVRELATKHALDIARRMLLGLSVPDSRSIKDVFTF